MAKNSKREKGTLSSRGGFPAQSIKPAFKALDHNHPQVIELATVLSSDKFEIRFEDRVFAVDPVTPTGEQVMVLVGAQFTDTVEEVQGIILTLNPSSQFTAVEDENSDDIFVFFSALDF